MSRSTEKVVETDLKKSIKDESCKLYQASYLLRKWSSTTIRDQSSHSENKLNFGYKNERKSKLIETWEKKKNPENSYKENMIDRNCEFSCFR